MMRVLIACMISLLANCAFGAGPWWFFNRNPQYYDPLIAGVREAQLSALFPAVFDRMPMMVRTDQKRIGWDIDVGYEIPIFGHDTSISADANGRPAPGQIGWGMWIPIDFHMIEDFREDSAPVLNTDYRFSGVFKVSRGLAENRWISARVQYGHESTHLGDEFSLHAERAFPTTFERINVSWQYLDLGLSYAGTSGMVSWSGRLGATSTFPFHESYYESGPGSLTISRIGPITPSKNWYDPYVGIEAIGNRALFHKTWDVYASVELRNRSVYDYHKADPNRAEERKPSVNLIAGLAKSGGGTIVGRFSPFVRYYHGVNPHGQFRNQKGYTEAGAGVRIIR